MEERLARLEAARGTEPSPFDPRSAERLLIIRASIITTEAGEHSAGGWTGQGFADAKVYWEDRSASESANRAANPVARYSSRNSSGVSSAAS